MNNPTDFGAPEELSEIIIALNSLLRDKNCTGRMGVLCLSTTLGAAGVTFGFEKDRLINFVSAIISDAYENKEKTKIN